MDSTNAYAARHLKTLPDRQVIAAEIQHHGQGRTGRHWYSAKPGNVYASIVLKPSEIISPTFPIASISLYLSLCVCRLLDQYQVVSELKWPNDILVGNLKIGGILGQSYFSGDRMEGLVLGIGINLNLEEEDLQYIDQPATSLNLLLERPIPDSLFLSRLLEGFFSTYDEFINAGFPLIAGDFKKRCSFLGKKVMIRLPGTAFAATALGFDQEGRLIVRRSDDGREETVVAGDLIPDTART